MQLQQLAYFVAITETRHFTRAAERLHVAQPSLSKQIRALEHELGADLFSRARGNISLTPAGETLLPFARRILADADNARQEVHELALLHRGRLRLGATPSLCTGLLPGVLRDYHHQYPGVQLVIEEGGSQDLVAALAEGALDLALIILPMHHTGPALTTRRLFRDELVVISSSSRPAPVGHDRIRVADLRGKQLVMFRTGYDLRELTVSVCRQAGFEPELAVEGGEMDAVLGFVEAGLGLAVVPRMVVADRPGYRITPFAEPGLSRTIGLAHRKDVPPQRAAQAFGHTLIEQVRRTRPAVLEADR
jgi:DNA-binding transcriptional LysR family regulator